MKTQTERLVVGGVTLLVGLLLGWTVRGAATYNMHTAMVSTYDDWRVACPAADAKDAACELVSDMLIKDQPNPIARATITTDKDGKLVMGFTVPLGVALEAGMGLQIGKDPVKIIAYRTCNAVGCISTTPFDDKLAASLKGASDAQVMVANLEGKAEQIPMSFKGYNTAFRAYKSAEAKRHSWFWRLWS